MSKKIAITGASGLIGTSLVRKLYERGDNIYIITRGKSKTGNDLSRYGTIIQFDFKSPHKISQVISGFDAVIHLAGASISGKRWSDEYKSIILKSRVNSTKVMVEVISKAKTKPKLFLTASAVGYYGNRGEETITEKSSKGNGFLAEVCNAWEEEANKIQKYDIRNVIVRIGIVLSKDGGALKKMVLPFKFFVGGILGSGRQYLPWVHIDDVVSIITEAIDKSEYSGVFNSVSPNPVKMSEFSKTIGKVLKRPSIFRVPEFLLKNIMGEAAELVIGGQKALPEKLLQTGYRFKFENLKDALDDVLK